MADPVNAFRVISRPQDTVIEEAVEVPANDDLTAPVAQQGQFRVVAPVEPAVVDPVVEPVVEEGAAILDQVETDTLGQRLQEQSEATNLELFGTFVQGAEGEIRQEQVITRMLGTGISALAETGIELAKEGFNALPEVIKDNLTEGAAAVVGPLLDSDLGQFILKSAEEGGAVYDAWKAENPEKAKDIESKLTILTAGTPTAALGKPGLLKAASEGLTKAAGKQAVKQREGFVDNLLKPLQRQKVKEDAALRTEESTGLFQPRTLQKTPQEQASFDAVNQLEGVNPSNTKLSNLNVIKDEIVTEAKALEKMLDDKPILVPKAEFRKAMEGATDRLTENPLLVGDAAKTADKVVSKMKELINKNKSTVAGIMKSRKELDAWVKKQKPKAFETTSGENALTTAVKEVRNTTNDFLNDIVPDGALRKSLNKQTALFNARDAMVPSVAIEGATRLARVVNKVTAVAEVPSSFKRAITAAAGLILAGGTAVVAGAGPAAVAGAAAVGLGVGGFKAVKSAAFKKSMATILRGVDKTINAAVDPAVIADLKLDRAFIIEQMNSADREE